MMIKAIFFDAFDTLFAVEKGASEQMVLSLMRERNVVPDPAAFHHEWKMFYRNASLSVPFCTEKEIFINRINTIADTYHVSLPADDLAEKTLHAASMRLPFPDVLPALNTLGKQYRLFIASNTDQQVLLDLLERYPLPLDGVFTSENLLCYKPSKEFYLKLLSATGLHPAETLFVGDSYAEDVEGPINAGINSVLLARDSASSASVLCHISSLAELPDYLRSL